MKISKPKRGRKPVEDKKVHVPLYVKQSTIKTLKGLEKIKSISYTAIEEAENNS